jgi:suppressor for copper-sensitivity B
VPPVDEMQQVNIKQWIMRVAVALMATAMGAAAAWAAADDAASPWTRNDQGQVRLIAAVTGVGDADHVQLGLEFQNKPGWKIYWRSPGDAGLPP